MKKRYILVALGVVSVLLGSLFYSIVVSAPGGEYDAWMDLNDDGVIDAVDLQLLAWIYGALGTPINKTQLLLDLAARIDSLNATLLADYYNQTDCDSLFALLAHLHSASDVSGGTLGVDQIRLGTMDGNHVIFFYEDGQPTGEYIYWWNDGETFVVSNNIQVEGDIESLSLLADMIQLGSAEGDHAIYFYEDGSPTGEYIYWQDSLDRFFVSDDVQVGGDIQVGGTITIPTTTRYYSVPAIAWLPYSDLVSVVRDSYRIYTTNADGVTLFAPINLPDGAVVTELRFWAYDNDPIENMLVELQRYNGTVVGSPIGMGSVWSAGASSDYREFATTSISYATIDNQNYAYLLHAVLTADLSTQRLVNVRITYTIEQPLP